MIQDAIIVAAGRGTRFSSKLPKQYTYLHHKRIIEYSLKIFTQNKNFRNIVIAYHPDDIDIIKEIQKRFSSTLWVEGGKERQNSVYKALQYLSQIGAPEVVFIHDAARPFVTNSLIENLSSPLKTKDIYGVFPSLAIKDCLREKQGDVLTTKNRKNFLLAQTPQAFHFSSILQAHKNNKDIFLDDDIALLEKEKIPFTFIEGDENNFKITTQNDFIRGHHMLQQLPYLPKTATGIDVHAFGEGSFITLCGIQIPHTHGLVGHSDADIGFHALADALYSLVSDGDIGSHFPSSDSSHKGKDSRIFIEHAYQKVKDKGLFLTHVDITFTCERPVLTPFRDKMRANTAKYLEMPIEHISIKATTTDKLGFTGRKEGILGIAQVSAIFPQEKSML